jgi:hypothetical protein
VRGWVTDTNSVLVSGPMHPFKLTECSDYHLVRSSSATVCSICEWCQVNPSAIALGHL